MNEILLNKQVAFVDTTIKGWHQIVSDVDGVAEVVLLTGEENQIEQIKDWCKKNKGFHGLHIFSHGSPGIVHLGSSVINAEFLKNDRNFSSSLVGAFGNQADIYLYGCNIGAEDGVKFLEILKGQVGGACSASSHPVGSEMLGGAQELDVKVGAPRQGNLKIPNFAGILSAPFFLSGEAFVGQSVIRLTYDQPLDQNNLPPLTAFWSYNAGTPGVGSNTGLVTYNGADIQIASVAVSGNVLLIDTGVTFMPSYQLQFHYVDGSASDLPNAIQNLAGEDAAQMTYSIITSIPSGPSVTSIIEANSATIVQASAASVTYAVTFDSAVTGVDVSDFAIALTGTAQGTVSTISGSGTTYSVTVSGIMGDGTMGLNLNSSGTGIQDSSNQLILGGYTGQVLTVDHTAPSSPIIQSLSLDTGTPGDGISQDVTPTYTGTGEPNAVLTMYDTDGTTSLGTFTVDINGNWGITSSQVTEGNHLFIFKQTDAAGNVSNGTSVNYILDTTAPSNVALSTTTVAELAATNGSTVALLSATDATNVVYSLPATSGQSDADNARFTISGTSLIAAENLAPGSYSIGVNALDDSGNDSVQFFTVTVTSGSVSAPSVVSVIAEDAAHTRLTPVDNTITEGATLLYTVTLSSGSNPPPPPPPPPAPPAPPATTPNNPQSLLSQSDEYSVAPALPPIPPAPSNSLNVSVAPQITIANGSEHTLAVGGTAAGVDIGSMSFSDGVTWKNNDATTGIIVLPTNVLSFSISVATLDDSIVERRESLSVSVDNVTATGYINDNDTGRSGPAVSSILNAAGSAVIPTEASSVVYTVIFDGVVTGVDISDFALALTGTSRGVISSVSGAGTTYSVTVSSISGDGSLGLNLKTTGTGIQDTSGRPLQGGYIGEVLVVDHTAPNPPTLALENGSNTGTLADTITSDSTPTIIGISEAFATVTLYDSDGLTLLGTMRANSDGRWSIITSILGEGVHNLTVKQADRAGNTSAASSALAVIIDTTPSTTGVTPVLLPASDSGIQGDGNTSASQPVITGTAEANSTITLYDTNGTTVLGTATADGMGNWNITTSVLSIGTHTLTFKQTDVAGNVSAASAGLTLTIVAPPTNTTIDGVQVGVTNVSLPGGGNGTEISIPIVTTGRAETTGNASVADIPLSTVGQNTLLLAQVGIGFGLTSSGGASQPAGSSLERLIQSIIAATPDHPADDQGYLTGNGRSFLSLLPTTVPLLVQTILPVTGNTAPTSSLTLIGTSTNTQHTALVIDLEGVASASSIILRDVDFAAIIGAATVTGDTEEQILAGDAASQTFVVGESLGSSIFAGGGEDSLQVTPSSSATTGSRIIQAAAPAESDTILHGGLGADAVIFADSRSSYNIEFSDAHIVVTEKSGNQSAAYVVNAETLQFADESVTVEQFKDMSAIAGLYVDVLNRQGEIAGLEFWAAGVKNGASLGQIALDFINSPEGRTQQQAFNGVAAHDVEILYEALFNRHSDAPGLAFWVEAMADGAALFEVADGFMHSPEANTHALAATQWDFMV